MHSLAGVKMGFGETGLVGPERVGAWGLSGLVHGKCMGAWWCSDDHHACGMTS